METNMIDGYSVYQKQTYEKTVKNKKEETVKSGKEEKTQSTGKTEQKQVELSDRAKALLEELKKKYSNMDFFVADYSSDEEAESYLSRGTKEYSVLIEPELLEEMAADEDTKNKYLEIIDGATAQMDEIKEQLGDDAENVSHIGFTVAKDGTVSFFAELEKSSEKQRERIEKAREEKRTQEKEQEKKAEKEKQKERLEGNSNSDYQWQGTGIKKTTVQADSIAELVEKIKSVDWDNVQTVQKPVNGGKFDFTV